MALRLNYKEIYNTLTSTKHKNKKIVFNPYTIVIFYSYHVIIPIILILFNIPYINNNQNTLVRFILWYIFFYVILYYFVKIDPGNVKNYSNNYFPLLNLIEDYDINIDDYCPICEIKHSERSKHCYICNTCIDNFDHHCIWMGKCVGKNNNHLFYFIQFLLLFEFVYNIIVCLESLQNEKIPFLNYKGIYSFYNKEILMIKYIITIFNIIIGIFGTYIIYPLIKFYINVLIKEKEEKKNKKKNDNDDSINNFKFYKQSNININELENENDSLLV